MGNGSLPRQIFIIGSRTGSGSRTKRSWSRSKACWNGPIGGRIASRCRLYELLPVEAIALPLPCRTRGSVIQEMVKLAARTGLLWDAAKMTEAVRVARGIASNCAGQRCCSAAPATTLGVDSGGTAAGFGPDHARHSFRRPRGCVNRRFLSHLFHRGPRASADSGPAQPVDRRQCLHDRIKEPAGAGGGPSTDPPHGGENR